MSARKNYRLLIVILLTILSVCAAGCGAQKPASVNDPAPAAVSDAEPAEAKDAAPAAASDAAPATASDAAPAVVPDAASTAVSDAAPAEAIDAGQTGHTSEPVVPEVEAGISSINKHGNVILTIGPETMENLGFEPADIILVRIGETKTEMPICTNYTDVDSGEPLCCFKDYTSGERSVILSINSGSFAEVTGIAQKYQIEEEPGFEWVFADGMDMSEAVSISMVEKQGYAEAYLQHIGMSGEEIAAL